MKKIVSLILITILTLTAFACNVEPKKLATPTGVTVTDEGLISWNSVENATGYKVSINGEWYTTDNSSYQVQSVINDFTYSIIATGDKFADSDPTQTYTFKGKGNPDPEPPAAEVTVAINGPAEIKSGHTVKLTANVVGIFDVSVTWTVIEGAEYATIDKKGNLTASVVDGDKKITVEARSKKAENAFATKVLTIVSKPDLTQDMLDALDDSYISFDGYVNIDLYKDSSLSSSTEPEQTYTSVITTAMNGVNWYAEYENATTGYMTPIYYKNVDNKPCQVGVNFMNEEEYFPMTDDFGVEMNWEEAGLYNSLAGLTVNDFTFDEETWRYVYSSSDKSLPARVIASANPYDFETDNFSLIIDGGEIAGIYSVSKPDYTISIGYKAIQRLYVALVCGEDYVEVPTIEKYSHEDIHDALNEAIDNMHALTNYTLDFKDLNVTLTSASYSEAGFTQTITEDLIHFKPFTIKTNTAGEEIRNYTENGEYGYKVMREGLYNAYFNDGNGTYTASRAYEGNINEAKPTFAFAGEIFRSYTENNDGSITYYVDAPMSPVASTFFYGVGNDINLYGIFATEYISGNYSFTPYVTVKDGYIVNACFYYNIGSLIYGIVEINYSDFNTASVPSEEVPVFETREVPTSWAELEIIVTESSSSTEDDVYVNALEYFKTTMFNDQDIAEKMPFFGDAIGDTYGFGLTTLYFPSGSSIAKQAVVLYYDVPLDTDYTITTSLNAVFEYLKSEGFTQTDANTFVKGDIAVVPVDENLDFMIYVYKV